MTATASDLTLNDTSEFSAAVQVPGGITVSPTSGLTTTEAGGTASFTVVLNTQPAANVVIGLSSNDVTEGTVSPASLTFTALNWNVAQTVTVIGVNDFLDDGDVSFSGAGGPQSTSRSVFIDVMPVNDAPQVIWPGPQSTLEDTALVFSNGTGNVIRVDDVDAGSSDIQVSLGATDGTLTLADVAGLSFTTGDGTSDTVVSFTGTIARVNAALDGLRFIPQAGFHGSSTVTIVADDQGHSGGTANVVTQVVVITIASVLDTGEVDNPTPSTTTTGGSGPTVNGIVPVGSGSGAIPSVGSDSVRDWPLSFGGGTVIEEEPEAVTPDPTLPSEPPAPAPEPMPQPVIEVRPPVAPVIENIAMVPETIRRPIVTPGWITLDSVDIRKGTTDATLKQAGWLGSGVSSMALAGYVVWNLNYSWLVAGALAARPLWRQFDPLVILEMWELARRKTDDDEEPVRDLFG